MFSRNPDDIVQEIAMEFLKARHVAFLVVEGHDDAKFWNPRIRGDTWRCIVAAGKSNVTGAIAHPQLKHTALGIVDADYDHLDGVACPLSVCRTDGHDLESLLIRSSALQKLLVELGSPDKIAAFEGSEGPVLGRLVSIGTELAAFRRANHVHRWNLKFKKNGGLERVNYGRFVDKKTWTLSRDAMVRTVLNYNSRYDLPLASVLAAIAALPSCVEPWHWLNGHDLAAILAIGFAYVLGSKNYDLMDIERELRLAHERTELETTTLCQSIRTWEAAAARAVLAF